MSARAMCGWLEDMAATDRDLSHVQRTDLLRAAGMLESAYTLAMLALQSARYAEDVEYRAAVDQVLASTREEG